MGCDYNLWRNLYIINIFLLTHPVWDVTTIIVFSFLHTKISTHTSRVGCDELVTAICLSKWRISTHTSRVGCDVGDARCSVLRCRFLLTHPVWDVTRDWSSLELQHSISTHTSRVGCDFGNIYARCNTFHFYSHIPCGMWHQPKPPQHQQEGFLLTHPVWDVTQNVCHVFFYTSISTHTSRVGCDSRMQLGFSCIFISTHTSRVGCDAENISKKEDMEFLLTHPVWDVTPFLYIISINPINFYSHIPCGMWLLGSLFYANDYLFLLTHPVWDVTCIAKPA